MSLELRQPLSLFLPNPLTLLGSHASTLTDTPLLVWNLMVCCGLDQSQHKKPPPHVELE